MEDTSQQCHRMEYTIHLCNWGSTEACKVFRPSEVEEGGVVLLEVNETDPIKHIEPIRLGKSKTTKY